MPLSQITVRRWGEEFYFASLDGKSYLPVNRFVPEPTAEHAEQLAALFEGDGNFKPMTFARRWFDQQPEDAEVIFHA
jgi:hypothetical protein